jgi:hypothetical protein
METTGSVIKRKCITLEIKQYNKYNKFTIVRLCTVQRYYKPCGTRHKFPNPIKYPGRFMKCIKKTGNKQL